MSDPKNPKKHAIQWGNHPLLKQLKGKTEVREQILKNVCAHYTTLTYLS